MDRLFKRYSDPMKLLDQMIRTGRFEEFVNEFVAINNEETEQQNKEQEDRLIWEIWLHRVFDKSFADFKNSLTQEEKAAPTPEEIKSIAMDSKTILAGFVPDEGLVNSDGTVQTTGNDSD
jgi:hypothetical protein